MNKKIISLKDFEITPNENVIERSQNFQSYIDQMEQFGCKNYWVMGKTGVGAKMQIEGYLDIHQQLEQGIAKFVGQEDAILFSSGFGANAGLLRAILGKNDIAYIDSYIHTSATSGLIGTNVKHIGHNDIDYLDMGLQEIQLSSYDG